MYPELHPIGSTMNVPAPTDTSMHWLLRFIWHWGWGAVGNHSVVWWIIWTSVRKYVRELETKALCVWRLLEVALGIDAGLDCLCAASGASGGRPGMVDPEPSMHTPIFILWVSWERNFGYRISGKLACPEMYWAFMALRMIESMVASTMLIIALSTELPIAV